MGRVNDDGVLGLVVDNEVGVVVATANPYMAEVPPGVSQVGDSQKRRTRWGGRSVKALHMGIDWICMAREGAVWRAR